MSSYAANVTSALDTMSLAGGFTSMTLVILLVVVGILTFGIVISSIANFGRIGSSSEDEEESEEDDDDEDYDYEDNEDDMIECDVCHKQVCELEGECDMCGKEICEDCGVEHKEDYLCMNCFNKTKETKKAILTKPKQDKPIKDSKSTEEDFDKSEFD